MQLIAVDENYSGKFIRRKQKRGEVCVYKPKIGTPDEVWVLEAFDLGASVIYSRDLDIPNLIERYGLPIEWKEF